MMLMMMINDNNDNKKQKKQREQRNHGAIFAPTMKCIDGEVDAFEVSI